MLIKGRQHFYAAIYSPFADTGRYPTVEVTMDRAV